MSGLTETEIMDRHVQALKEARDACQWLAKNADPEWLAPRGRHYGNLKRALKALEGSSRQMAHFRGDGRWIKLGVLYARAMLTVHKAFLRQNWVVFRDIVPLFENGLVRMDDLATRRTGTTGPILPKRTDWLIMPDQVHISRGLVH